MPNKIVILLHKIYLSIFKKRLSVADKELTLFQQFENARNNFMHFAMRTLYDNGGFRRTVSIEERNYCISMANKYDILWKEIREKIIEQNNK